MEIIRTFIVQIHKTSKIGSSFLCKIHLLKNGVYVKETGTGGLSVIPEKEFLEYQLNEF